MIQTIRIALARRAHSKALAAALNYNSPRTVGWNVLIQIALDERECRAANRLARAINPTAILRAF